MHRTRSAKQSVKNVNVRRKSKKRRDNDCKDLKDEMAAYEIFRDLGNEV